MVKIFEASKLTKQAVFIRAYLHTCTAEQIKLQNFIFFCASNILVVLGIVHHNLIIVDAFVTELGKSIKIKWKMKVCS